MNLNSLGGFGYDYLKVCDVVCGINFFCMRTTFFLVPLLLVFIFFCSFNALRRLTHQSISFVILTRGFYLLF